MKNKKKQLCQECFGAKNIYNGEEYVECTTCNGEGITTKPNNELFLQSIQLIEEE